MTKVLIILIKLMLHKKWQLFVAVSPNGTPQKFFSLDFAGSEWRYVILSTVCSLPSKEIVSEPDGTWLAQHIGFVGDPNQINVAITRAKEGLCIIGETFMLT